jgi:hypothetical protein
MVSASMEFAGSIHFDTERSLNAPHTQSSNQMVPWVPKAAAADSATTLCLCSFTCGLPPQVCLILLRRETLSLVLARSSSVIFQDI